jgi:hypothetical protein
MSDQMPAMPRMGPECGNPPEMCRLTTRSEVKQPTIPWNPEYNGLGQMVNADPNTFIKVTSCSVCSGEWEDTVTMVAGGTSNKETKVLTPPVVLATGTRARR